MYPKSSDFTNMQDKINKFLNKFLNNIVRDILVLAGWVSCSGWPAAPPSWPSPWSPWTRCSPSPSPSPTIFTGPVRLLYFSVNKTKFLRLWCYDDLLIMWLLTYCSLTADWLLEVCLKDWWLNTSCWTDRYCDTLCSCQGYKVGSGWCRDRRWNLVTTFTLIKLHTRHLNLKTDLENQWGKRNVICWHLEANRKM